MYFLVLLSIIVDLPPHTLAQVSEPLQASASGEYSVVLSELPRLLSMEMIQQERLLSESFEQQALDLQEEYRASLRELTEDAAEARRQAREEYSEELRELREDLNEKIQRLPSDLSPERYQRKREKLKREHRDDIEDLKIDNARLIDKIAEDKEEERDELTAVLEQTLFDLRTDNQYALEKLKSNKMEELLRHYQRQLEMEALRKIMSSLVVGPLGDQIVFEILDYLGDRVYIEVTSTDLGRSRTRIMVTLSAEPATIAQAMEMFDVSGGQKTPGEGSPLENERAPSDTPF